MCVHSQIDHTIQMHECSIHVIANSASDWLEMTWWRSQLVSIQCVRTCWTICVRLYLYMLAANVLRRVPKCYTTISVRMSFNFIVELNSCNKSEQQTEINFYTVSKWWTRKWKSLDLKEQSEKEIETTLE